MSTALPGAGPEIDRRAIGAAVAVESAVAALITVTGAPALTAIGIPVIGGVVVGLTSRNFDEEYFDGAIAAGAAPIVVPIVALGVTWVTNPSLSVTLLASIGSIIFSVALPVVLLGMTVAAAVGAVLSYQTASIRRRADNGIEFQ